MTGKPFEGLPELYDTPLEMFNVHRYHPTLSTPYKSNAAPLLAMSSTGWSSEDLLENNMIVKSHGGGSFSGGEGWSIDSMKTINRHLRAKQFSDPGWNNSAVWFRQNAKVTMTRFRVDVPANGSIGIHGGISTQSSNWYHWLLFKAYQGGTGRLWQCQGPQIRPATGTKNYIYPSEGRCQGQNGYDGLTECLALPVEIDFSPGEHLFEIIITGVYMRTPVNNWGFPPSSKFGNGWDNSFQFVQHIHIDGQYVTSLPFTTPFWGYGWGGPTHYVTGARMAPVPVTFDHEFYPGMSIDNEMWGDFGDPPSEPCKVWSYVEYVLDYELNGAQDCNPAMATTQGREIEKYSTKCTINNVSGNRFGTDRYLDLDTGTLSLFEPLTHWGWDAGPGRATTGKTGVRTVGTFPVYTGRLTNQSAVDGRSPLCLSALGPIWSMPAAITLDYQFGTPADPDDFAPTFVNHLGMGVRYDSIGQDPSCSFAFTNKPNPGSWADLLINDFIPGYRNGTASTSGKYNQ